MITITNVSHTIDNNLILNDISLIIPNGGITALIGANGAGKSTLLSLIARLQPLQTGKIWIDEMDITHTPSVTIAKRLAILTQDNSVHSRITVYDLLMFGRYPHHQGKVNSYDIEIVEDALKRFDLTPLKKRYLSELSGGQRQRAFIAMIFCQQTSHILLDEPLNNLDMFHAKELMQLLRQLTDELKLTTVMVVHDVNIAAAYADTIIAMKSGKIIFSGSSQEIITPHHLEQVFKLNTEILEHKGKKIVISHI